MFIKIKKLYPDSKVPERNNNDDAGLDLFASEDYYINHGQVVKVKTGIAIQVCREANDFSTYAGFIFDRSSLGSKGISKLAGLIDQGYTGEIIVCLTNHINPALSYKISKGDKVAQIVFQKVETPVIREVTDFVETARGTNGFGSSGA